MEVFSQLEIQELYNLISLDPQLSPQHSPLVFLKKAEVFYILVQVDKLSLQL